MIALFQGCYKPYLVEGDEADPFRLQKDPLLHGFSRAQADLLIMGVPGRNSLELALFGSTTQRVIQLGPCPALAVHIG